MDIPMVVSKWTPYAEEAQPAMKSIKLWITLKDVPLSMFTDKGLEFLASVVGKPIRLHPKTEACVSFDEAQVLVEADLTKELPKEYVFTGEEEGELDAVVHFSYPWLPPRCIGCGKWDHLKDSCLVVATTVVKKTHSPKTVPEKTDQGVLSMSEAMMPLKEGFGDTKTLELQISEPTSTVGVCSQNKGDDQGWITPPGSDRSPGNKSKELRFGEVSILSNAYTVLSEKGDCDDVIILTDKQDDNTVTGDDGVISLKEKLAGEPPATTEMSLGESLPRVSKTFHKVVSVPSTQLTRIPPRDQSKRNKSKNR